MALYVGYRIENLLLFLGGTLGGAEDLLCQIPSLSLLQFTTVSKTTR